MKQLRAIKWIPVLAMVIALALPLATALANQKTFIGEVNDNYQIIADGQIYEIADTKEGNDLAENYVNAKVKVTGTIEESEDMKIITITSYQVISE